MLLRLSLAASLPATLPLVLLFIFAALHVVILSVGGPWTEALLWMFMAVGLLLAAALLAARQASLRTLRASLIVPSALALVAGRVILLGRPGAVTRGLRTCQETGALVLTVLGWAGLLGAALVARRAAVGVRGRLRGASGAGAEPRRGWAAERQAAFGILRMDPSAAQPGGTSPFGTASAQPLV